MNEKKRVLFLTTVFPYPLDNGGKIRAFNNIKALSEEYKLDLVCFAEGELEEEYIKELKKYCVEIRIIQKVFTNNSSKRTTIKNIIKSLIKNTPFIIEKFYDKQCKDYINEFLAKYQYKAIFFEHLSITCYEKLFNGSIKKILSQQNCEHILMKRRYDEEKNIIKKLYIGYECIKLKKYEINICNHFDRVIMLSEEDKNSIITAGHNGHNIDIIPIGINNSGYVKKIHNIENVKNILFMGTMSWYPNEQGILWFINNVWEELKKKHPEFTLYVVGKSPSKEIISRNNINNIIVTGYVDDINEYIDKCDVCIIPLFIGGGMRVKILESMAKGIPCISTNIGAEGIDIENNRNILIANNKDEFVGAIERLNKDQSLYEKIVHNGIQLIEEKYSVNLINKKIQKLLN